MTAFAFTRTPYKGGSGARFTREKISYIERTGEHAPAVEYPLINVQDDCRHRETLNLPLWAQTNRDWLREADRWEGPKRDAFVEWKFDLPKEMSHEQHIALIRDIFAVHLRSIHAVTWVKHEPKGLQGELHAHVHAFWSARPLAEHEITPAHFFSRRNPKTRELGTAYSPEREKQLISDITNLHLEAADFTTRWCAMPYKDRGIAMTPEPKALPSDSYRFASTGEISARLQKVLDHRQAMEPHKAEEARDAVERWEARKQEMGIAQGTPIQEALGRIADYRGISKKEQLALKKESMKQLPIPPETLPYIGNVRSKIYHAPRDPSYHEVRSSYQILFATREEAEHAGYRAARNQHYGKDTQTIQHDIEALEQEQATLDTYMRALDTEIARERHAKTKGLMRPPSEQLRVAKLLTEAVANLHRNDTKRIQQTKAHQARLDAFAQQLPKGDKALNPVLLRKLDHLLSVDLAQEPENLHAPASPFHFQKETDESLSR